MCALVGEYSSRKSLISIVLFAALHALFSYTYCNAAWLTKSVEHAVEGTYPGLVWLITRDYSTLADLQFTMLNLLVGAETCEIILFSYIDLVVQQKSTRTYKDNHGTIECATGRNLKHLRDVFILIGLQHEQRP